MTYNTSIYGQRVQSVRIISAQCIHINMYNNLLLYSVKIIATYINWCTMCTRIHIGTYCVSVCVYSHFCRIFYFLKAISCLIKCPTYTQDIAYTQVCILYLYPSPSLVREFIYLLISPLSSRTIHAAPDSHLYCHDLLVPLHHTAVSIRAYQQTSIPYCTYIII